MKELNDVVRLPSLNKYIYYIPSHFTGNIHTDCHVQFKEQSNTVRNMGMVFKLLKYAFKYAFKSFKMRKLGVVHMPIINHILFVNYFFILNVENCIFFLVYYKRKIILQ